MARKPTKSRGRTGGRGRATETPKETRSRAKTASPPPARAASKAIGQKQAKRKVAARKKDKRAPETPPASERIPVSKDRSQQDAASMEQQLIGALDTLAGTINSATATLSALLGRDAGPTGTLPRAPGNAPGVAVSPPPPPPPGGAVAPSVATWLDDAFSTAVAQSGPALGAVVNRQLPVLTNRWLTVKLSVAQPRPAIYRPGMPEFGYWVTAEALARGIEFWNRFLPPGTTWRTINPMPVRVNVPSTANDLNARYTRFEGLLFERAAVGSHVIDLGESPDIVFHELGHAVLDAIRPQLFDLGSDEVWAFHESFGDISAILCALQVDEMRQAVLRLPDGNLKLSSQLSRLGEQFGWALRQAGRAAEVDCFRNAANRFQYQHPATLPSWGQANELTSQRHSFSRIFTGALLDVLAALFNLTPKRDADLLSVSEELAQLLVTAVLSTPVSTDYYSQVAAAIVEAYGAAGGDRSVVSWPFIHRRIIAADRVTSLANTAPPAWAAAAPGGPGPGVLQMAETTFPIAPLDAESAEMPTLEMPLNGVSIRVHAPLDPKRFEVASAAAASAPADDSVEARLHRFLFRLIERGELDLEEARKHDARAAAYLPATSDRSREKRTHVLVPTREGLVLKRRHFDCAFCGPSSGPQLRAW